MIFGVAKGARTLHTVHAAGGSFGFDWEALTRLNFFGGGGGNGLRKDCRLGVGMIWGVSPSRTELATLS